MVLVKTGATDKQAKDREDDELGKRNLTVAELRQRQAELAKTRALLFYEQMKNHRINKIKSKAYHRIKKRQRVRKGQEERLLQELSLCLAGTAAAGTMTFNKQNYPTCNFG